MKTFLIALALFCGTVATHAQASSDFRPELAYAASKNDTVATDTVYSSIIAVPRAFPPLSAADTAYRVVGSFENVDDTCTYSVDYRVFSVNGYLLNGTTWSQVGTLNATQLLGSRAVFFNILVPAATVRLQFRVIRAKGATQKVTTSHRLYLYHYYYSR